MNAIEKLIDEDPDVTCHQVKLRLPKLLKAVGRRTIQRVILQKLDEGLGIPSLVSAEVPFWTEDLRKRRLSWCRKYKRLTRQDWEKVLFCDESPFHTVSKLYVEHWWPLFFLMKFIFLFLN